MLELRRVAHVNLSIESVAAARRFYGEVLGLPEAPRPADAGARAGAWYALGEVELHLSEEPGADNARSKRHVAFEVADVPAARAHFAARGVAIEEARVVPGVDRFFVRDPSGNRLEFYAPTRSG